MVVFKEKLPVDTGVMYIEMPYINAEEARKAVLHIDLQYGEPYMWYDAKEYDLPVKNYLILAVGTGHYWGNYHGEDVLTREMHIGTALISGGLLVLHYFLVEADNPNLNLLL